VTPVSLTDGGEVVRRLAAEGYRTVIIGGLAIEAAGFGGTQDVDVMVPVASFDGVIYLKGEGLEMYSTTGGWVTNGRLTLKDGTVVPFDVLSPNRFVGSGKSGEKFFQYAVRTGLRTELGLVASPAVVTYTRLLVAGPHGEIYIERIRRDLDAGAPRRWLDDAIRISARFGMEKRVRTKVIRILAGARGPSQDSRE
jgi:hypothetical protein